MNHSSDVVDSFQSMFTTVCSFFNIEEICIYQLLINLFSTDDTCVDDISCIDFSLTNSPVVNEDFVATTLKVYTHTLTPMHPYKAHAHAYQCQEQTQFDNNSN